MQKLATLCSLLVVAGVACAAEPVPPAKAPTLDAFPSGPWQGKNSVFQAKNFDAVLGADRSLLIQPKEEGKNVGPPVRVVFNAHYVSDLRSIPRDLVSLEKRPAPSMQPKRVEIAGHYTDKVRFGVTVDFAETGITMEGEMKDPPSTKQPTAFGYAVVFPPAPGTTSITTPEAAEPLVSGCTLKLTDASKKERSVRLTEFPPTAPNAVLRAELSGFWGSRRIIVEAFPSKKNGNRVANLGNYGSQMLFKGGWYLSRASTDKTEGGPLIIRCE